MDKEVLNLCWLIKKGLIWHCAAVHLCKTYYSNFSLNKVKLDCVWNWVFATLKTVLVSFIGTGWYTASFGSDCLISCSVSSIISLEYTLAHCASGYCCETPTSQGIYYGERNKTFYLRRIYQFLLYHHFDCCTIWLTQLLVLKTQVFILFFL